MGQIAAILAFMLIPLWIPLAAVAVGTVTDAVRGGGRAVATTARSSARTAPAHRRADAVAVAVPVAS